MDKQKLIEEYAPLVKRIAYHMMAKLPASVQVDDLIQTGLIGLLDALDNYDASPGATFETYAVQRIRGAMLDELRGMDWLPRSARKNQRRIEAAIASLEQQLGRAPDEGEIAEALEMDLADYRQTLLDARGHQLLHYEDFHGGGENDDFLEHFVADERAGPLDAIQDQRFRSCLVAGIGALPEREQLLMALYYEQELNLREIGDVMGVSESRVCQLHGQAVARLRAYLKNWL